VLSSPIEHLLTPSSGSTVATESLSSSVGTLRSPPLLLAHPCSSSDITTLGTHLFCCHSHHSSLSSAIHLQCCRRRLNTHDSSSGSTVATESLTCRLTPASACYFCTPLVLQARYSERIFCCYSITQ
jgi:hypothetical protein